jgi:hypothetical protein
MFDDRLAREAGTVSDMGLETPVGDSVEQQQDAIGEPGEDDPGEPGDGRPYDIPLEADEADAAEQARGVDLDADEYR